MIKYDVCKIFPNNRNVFKLKCSIDNVLNKTTINRRKMVKIATINSSFDTFKWITSFIDIRHTRIKTCVCKINKKYSII